VFELAYWVGDSTLGIASTCSQGKIMESWGPTFVGNDSDNISPDRFLCPSFHAALPRALELVNIGASTFFFPVPTRENKEKQKGGHAEWHEICRAIPFSSDHGAKIR
jgi:hypothetical protein